MQLLLESKVVKAELYLIGGYHNEWLELTYYIETLFILTCKVNPLFLALIGPNQSNSEEWNEYLTLILQNPALFRWW